MIKKILSIGIIALLFFIPKVQACAVCYGAKDSSLTKGLMVGIITLLVILTGVLSCMVVFLWGVRKRSKLLRSLA